MLLAMAKSFVSVASITELSGVFVSEYEEGALAWSADIATYLTLKHNVPIDAALPTGSIRPQPGSPQAGSPLAAWVAFETHEPN